MGGGLPEFRQQSLPKSRVMRRPCSCLSFRPHPKMRTAQTARWRPFKACFLTFPSWGDQSAMRPVPSHHGVRCEADAGMEGVRSGTPLSSVAGGDLPKASGW